MNSTLRVIGGFAISVALVGFLLWQIDPAEVAGALGRSRPALLPLVLVPFALDISLRTVRWRILLARDPRPGYRNTFRYLVIGYLANTLLPARLGELVRAHLLGTREAVGPTRALGSIAMERGLDVVAAASLGALASQAAGVPASIVTALGTLAVAGGLVLIGLAVLPRRFARRLVDDLVLRAGVGRAARVVHGIGRFAHGLLDAAEPRRIAVCLVLSLAAWIVTSGVFLVTATSLGIAISPAAIVACVVAANLGAAIPSAPAGVGPYEFGVVIIATSVGLDGPTALAFGLLSHICTTVPVSVLGAYELSGVRWNLARLRRIGEIAGADMAGEG
jgi:hypothetical protein